MARKEKDTTKWEQKGGSRKVKSSEPQKRRTGNDNAANDSSLLKTALIVGASLIIAALAKGVKESEYYDNGKKDENKDA